jgi:hypothetical protein
MTFAGLYMYDRAKLDVARGERKVQRKEYKENHLLPLNTSDLKYSAPPTPDPFLNDHPLSATSATAPQFPGEPRRRSSSFDQARPLPQNGVPQNGNWNLGIIKEMTPPVTPRVISPLSPGKQLLGQERGAGHRRRYSGSSGTTAVNGTRKEGDRSHSADSHLVEIEEKASYE